MRAIRVHQFGGPEAMELEELPTPKPGAGQALVRIEAAGVNFIDIYQRTRRLQAAAAATASGSRARAPSRRWATASRRSRVGDRVAWTRHPGRRTRRTTSCRPTGW